ncbi:MAG: helix-turn-helix transcriptional regulator [Thermomicrobiales bacterium]
MTRSIGQAIRARRRELGLTQEQFAELLGEGVRQSEVSRLERGHVSLPRRERLLRIGEVLDIPVGELLMLSAWAEGGKTLPPRTESRLGLPAAEHRLPMDELFRNARATMERTREILDSLDGTDRMSSGARD